MQKVSITQPGRLLSALSVAALSAGLLVAPTTAAVPNIAKVVISGDSADGNGRFSDTETSFSLPRLNNAGQTAFTAKMFGTINGNSPFTGDHTAIFRGTPTNLTTIMRTKDDAFGDGTFDNPFDADLALNNNGQVAFVGDIRNSANNVGIFRGNGSTLTTIVRRNDPAFPPALVGKFVGFQPPALNDAGQIAAIGVLTDTFSGLFESVVIRSDGVTNNQIAGQNHNAPVLGTTFDVFRSPSINASGNVLFLADTTFTNSRDGIFVGDGTTLDALAFNEQAAPDGQGGFTKTVVSFRDPSYNDQGQAAFHGFTPPNQNGGIFRIDENEFVQITHSGDNTPSGNGTFSRFSFETATLNSVGQVAFRDGVNNTSGGVTDDTGLFIGDGNSLIEAVREGDAISGGIGSIHAIGEFAFNDEGQIAYFAEIDLENGGGESDSFGLFVFDEASGLTTEIIRNGDPLFGLSITALGFAGGEGSKGNSRSGFNNDGQVAFRFVLNNGFSGIAIADLPLIPEPGTLGMLAMGGFMLLRRRVA